MEQRTYTLLEDAQKAILERNPKSIFLVTGNGSFTNSGAERRLQYLLGRNVTRFNRFTTNPDIRDVERGIRLYNQVQPDYVVTVGGGSVIDMAKLVRGLANVSHPEEHLREGKPIDTTNVPLIAIPTTSGSGSESTPYAVAYINGLKYSFHHNSNVPDEIVLDPTLTKSLPIKQTASSGFDALSQAVEAYWSVNSTDESKQHSKKAIGLVLNNLEKVVSCSDDLYSRKAMMIAANEAGKAIAIAKTTASHAISYSMTSRFGIPHGHAVVLTLGDILEYNAGVSEKDCVDSRGVDYVKTTMSEIVDMFKAKTPEEAKERIKILMRSVGLKTTLKEVGVSDVDTIIREVNLQRLKNNPRKLEEKDLRNILRLIS